MKVLFRIWFLFLLVTVAAFGPVSAQQPVYTIRITVQIAPPYPPYLDDYKNKAIVSFTNLSQTPADIYLRGRVSNDRGEFIQTKPNVFTLIPIHVPGLQTLVLQGGQVDGSYLDLNNLQTNLNNTEYANLFQLGLIPEGFYTFCLYAYTRNGNGNYIPVSDPQAGSTCSMFNVGYVVPPSIINPLDQSYTAPTTNQNLLISWTRPVGNMQGANLVYDLYIVKVIEGEDPNTAVSTSVQYGAGIFFHRANYSFLEFPFTNLTGFPLEEGSQYAVLVQARDLNGKTAFENNGMSAVVTFTYGSPPNAFSGPMKILSAASCSCATDLSTADKSNNNQAVTAGSSFSMNGLTLGIATLNPINPSDYTISGTGKVTINHVPVMIQFSQVIVNKDGIAIDGTATGIASPDFQSLLGGVGPPVISTDGGFQAFYNQIKNYNINVPANAVGLPLPFGLNTIGAPDQFNIGITSLTLTPTQSTYNAVGVVELLDANSVLSLAATNVCFSNSSLFCGDAYFSLASDLSLPPISLTLKAPKGADQGTYAIDSAGKITHMHIEAIYQFPPSLVTKPSGVPDTATVNTDFDHWSDWIASVAIDSFIVPSVGNSLVFQPATAYYDHSTKINPPGMPTSFSDPDLALKNSDIATPDWTGFYLPTLQAAIPSFVVNIDSANAKPRITLSNLLIDHGGVTGALLATNIIPLSKGSLDHWFCSLDTVSLKFLNSSFLNGGMYGEILMPFSDSTNQQSAIAYSCTLTNNNGLVYQLVANQTKNVDFSAWYAKIDLRNFGVLVTNASGTFHASASISGSLNFDANIGDYPISMNLVDVDSLTIQTTAPYIKAKSYHFGLSSPQHSFDGFDLSVTDVNPVFSTGFGLQFDVNVGLVDSSADLGINATGQFTIMANILNGSAPHLSWQALAFQLDSFAVDGKLIIGRVKGNIAFKSNDPTFGNCVKGSVSAYFAGIDAGGISADIMVGNNGFNYWYVDASLTLPVPIPLGPGVSLQSFGGGGYYNMKKIVDTTTVNQVFSADYLNNLQNYVLDNFVPSSGKVGFSAMIGISSNDGYLYSGNGNIGMTFDVSNGLSISSIDFGVYAEMMKNTVSDDPSAVIQGMLSCHIGIGDGVYSILGAVQINYAVGSEDIITGHAGLAILSDGGLHQYYFKLGEPDKDKRVSLSIADIVTMNGYFEAGSGIDAIPGPDPDIINVSLLPGYQPLPYHYDKPLGGMVFGASFSWNQYLNYLVFYVKIGMGVGFDISLTHQSTGCGITPAGGLGMNEWYAIGQVYAHIYGEIGLGVDTWFFHGNVSAGSVDAGVLLRSGLPHPSWFDGEAYLSFSALNGLITGTVNFHVSIGTICVPGPDSSRLALPLIQEFLPADQSTNVPVFTNPEVLFNYPADGHFDVWLPNNDGTLDSTLHSYQLELQTCEVDNLDNGTTYASTSNPASHAHYRDDQQKDLLFSPDNMLDPQTNYRFNVTVNAYEVIAGNRNYLQDTVAFVNFKTGYCRYDQMISNPQVRLGAFPYPGQRYFLPGESKQGAIILDANPECANQPGENYDLIARFTTLKNHQAIHVDEVNIPKQAKNQEMDYSLPTFQNDCLVRVEIIKRVRAGFSVTSASATAFNGLVGSSTSQTSLNRSFAANPGGHLSVTAAAFQAAQPATPAATGLGSGKSGNPGSPATSTGTSGSPAYPGVDFTNFDSTHQTVFTNKTLDIVLYSYYFRTSHFNTVSEKVKNMYYSGTSSYTLGSPTVAVTAYEKFDAYDVKGFVSESYSNAQIYATLPLINLKENANYNSWTRNYAVPCVYNIYSQMGISLDEARNQNDTATYLFLQQIGFACATTTNCVPLAPINVLTYDNILSPADIAADELPIYLQSFNPVQVVAPAAASPAKTP